MRQKLEAIERAKHKRSFDDAMRVALERVAARKGKSIDARAATKVIKQRINRDIILAGLANA